MSFERSGALLCLEFPEGTPVYVDPKFVAYVEPHGQVARLVFLGGNDLLVKNEPTPVHEAIGAAKITS